MITKEDYLLEKVRKLPPQLILQKVRDAFDKETLKDFSIIRDSSILHCIEDLIDASVIEATIEEDVKVPKHWSALEQGYILQHEYWLVRFSKFLRVPDDEELFGIIENGHTSAWLDFLLGAWSVYDRKGEISKRELMKVSDLNELLSVAVRFGYDPYGEAEEDKAGKIIRRWSRVSVWIFDKDFIDWLLGKVQRKIYDLQAEGYRIYEYDHKYYIEHFRR